MSNTLKQTPNKKVSTARMRTRQGLGLLAVTGLFVAANAGYNHFVPMEPNEAQNPALSNPDKTYKPYTVKEGDTLTEIVTRAFPEYEPYSDEFDAKVGELAKQLDKDDQYLGVVQPGDKLMLDESANISDKSTEVSAKG